jgi:hypothetical protein
MKRCINCIIGKKRLSDHCKKHGGVAPLTPPILGSLFSDLPDCDMDNCGCEVVKGKLKVKDDVCPECGEQLSHRETTVKGNIEPETVIREYLYCHGCDKEYEYPKITDEQRCEWEKEPLPF